MKTHSNSAKIYDLAARRRTAGSRARRDGAKPANELTLARLPTTACGACWYHEDAVQEAVRDADPPRKR